MRALALGVGLVALASLGSSRAGGAVERGPEIGACVVAAAAAGPQHGHDARVPIAASCTRLAILDLVSGLLAPSLLAPPAVDGVWARPSWRRLPRMHVDGPVDHLRAARMRDARPSSRRPREARAHACERPRPE